MDPSGRRSLVFKSTKVCLYPIVILRFLVLSYLLSMKWGNGWVTPGWYSKNNKNCFQVGQKYVLFNISHIVLLPERNLLRYHFLVFFFHHNAVLYICVG